MELAGEYLQVIDDNIIIAIILMAIITIIFIGGIELFKWGYKKIKKGLK